MDLDEAGILDMLFVTSKGLPIAVEVKLTRNAQARREVVAQAIDYLSALTAFTVDELDHRVNGSLEAALQNLAGEDDLEFDRLWQAVGTNLRAGQARLVVTLDAAPAPLERIFRFLARNSNLDVRLVTVRRYSSATVGDVFVPQEVVVADTVDRAGGQSSAKHRTLNWSPCAKRTMRAHLLMHARREPRQECGRFGLASGKRRSAFITSSIAQRITSGPSYTSKVILVARSRTRYRAREVAGGAATLTWDQSWSGGRGRLAAQFPLETAPQIVARAMVDLIAMTRASVSTALSALVGKQAATA